MSSNKPVHTDKSGREIFQDEEGQFYTMESKAMLAEIAAEGAYAEWKFQDQVGDFEAINAAQRDLTEKERIWQELKAQEEADIAAGREPAMEKVIVRNPFQEEVSDLEAAMVSAIQDAEPEPDFDAIDLPFTDDPAAAAVEIDGFQGVVEIDGMKAVVSKPVAEIEPMHADPAPTEAMVKVFREAVLGEGAAQQEAIQELRAALEAERKRNAVMETELTETRAAFARVSEDNKALVSSIGDLKAAVVDLKTALEAETAARKAAVAELAHERATFVDRARAWAEENMVKPLKAEIATLKADLAEARAAVADAGNAAVAAIRGEMDRMKKGYEAIIRAKDAQIDGLKEKVANLRESVFGILTKGRDKVADKIEQAANKLVENVRPTERFAPPKRPRTSANQAYHANRDAMRDLATVLKVPAEDRPEVRFSRPAGIEWLEAKLGIAMDNHGKFMNAATEAPIPDANVREVLKRCRDKLEFDAAIRDLQARKPDAKDAYGLQCARFALAAQVEAGKITGIDARKLADEGIALKFWQAQTQAKATQEQKATVDSTNDNTSTRRFG